MQGKFKGQILWAFQRVLNAIPSSGVVVRRRDGLQRMFDPTWHAQFPTAIGSAFYLVYDDAPANFLNFASKDAG